jgi:hypothetical protein
VAAQNIATIDRQPVLECSKVVIDFAQLWVRNMLLLPTFKPGGYSVLVHRLY